MLIAPFFHTESNTWSYIVAEHAGGDAAVIDPALDFDPATRRIGTRFAQALLTHLREHDLQLRWILETHAHADHLSAAAWLKHECGMRPAVAIGAGIVAVQSQCKETFGLGDDFVADGSQFDRLLRDGDRLPLGALSIEVMGTPGHTSDGLSYRIGDAVFVGDTLFSPAAGTARCDFPGGDAGELYRSIQRLYDLPESTRLFLCHDYPQAGAPPRHCITLDEMRRENRHVRADTAELDYVHLRRERDATLPVPRLLRQALQANIRAGEVPGLGREGGVLPWE